MANYANLKSSIQNAIKANGNNEITGNLLQQILVAMVSNLGAAFQFAGVATQSTNPGTPDYNVAYLAGPGTYQNMGGSVVPSGYIGVIAYNGSWGVQLISVGSGGSGSVVTFNNLPNGTTQILVDGAPQATIPSQYTLLKLSAFTTTPDGIANGAFYYNTSDKKIYQKQDSTVAVIPYYDGAIYTYNNALYVWNGTDLINVAGGGGGVDFSTEPDDLTLVPAAQQGDPSVLKFSDRAYNSQSPNGMGYKILRKNASFASQVTDTNTIYEIRYDFSLGGASVTIPVGACIKLVGGSINNGVLVLSSNVSIIGVSKNQNNNLQVKSASDIENIIIKDVRFVGNNTIQIAIGRTGQEIINKLTICGCVISGYSHGGISVNAINALYDGNLIYACGTDGDDSNVDLCVGYVDVENLDKSPNIIVTNNRLLSNKVHRHIDVGELYSETNIIINNNICVSMKDDLSEEEPNTPIAHGIMVGYAGVSSNRDRFAIISNNIIKHGHWGGIYVRGASTNDAVNTKYAVLINGNTIFGIIKDETEHITGGICVEVQEGTIIANNLIRNCTQGINCGQMYAHMDCLIANNTIDSISIGVTIDSFCKRLKISNNQIVSGGTGISIAPTSLELTADVYNSKIDIQGNNIDAAANGVFLYNVNCAKAIVSHNVIVTSVASAEGVGVLFLRHGSVTHLLLDGNFIRNFKTGFRSVREGFRADHITIANNEFHTCTTGIGVTNSSSVYFLLHFNDIFTNCGAIGDNSVRSGYFNQDGSMVVFGVAPMPWDIGNTIYKRGDIINSNGQIYYDSAHCVTETTIDSGGNPVYGSAKWRVHGYRATLTDMNDNKSNLYAATIGYDVVGAKCVVYNGVDWINMDGTPLT